jgi:hypothetical protein
MAVEVWTVDRDRLRRGVRSGLRSLDRVALVVDRVNDRKARVARGNVGDERRAQEQ